MILLKLSQYYLHSDWIQPMSFLQALCKGCEPHPNGFGAVSVPCEYTMWGRQKLWVSYKSKHVAVHFFSSFFCCNSQEQIAQIRNRHWTVALQLFKKNAKHLQDFYFFWQCSLIYGFNPHFLHAHIYCCEWNNCCLEIFNECKNVEYLDFPKISIWKTVLTSTSAFAFIGNIQVGDNSGGKELSFNSMALKITYNCRGVQNLFLQWGYNVDHITS